jgi:hypothetical protein
MQFASAANAVQAMTNPRLNKLIARLSDAEREQAWAEIERALSRYEGPDGLEIPGELLIGVGTK